MRLYCILFILLCLLSGCVALELGASVDATLIANAGELEGISVGEVEASLPVRPSVTLEGLNIKLADARITERFGNVYVTFEGEVNAKVEWQLLNKDSIRTSNGKTYPLHGVEIFRTSSNGAKVMLSPSDYSNSVKYTLSPNQAVMVTSMMNGWYAVNSGVGSYASGYAKVSDNSISPIFKDSRFLPGHPSNNSYSTCNVCSGSGRIIKTVACNICGGTGTVRYAAPRGRYNPSGSTIGQCWKCHGQRQFTVEYFCSKCRGTGQINTQALNQAPIRASDRVDPYRRGPYGQTVYIDYRGVRYFLDNIGRNIYVSNR